MSYFTTIAALVPVAAFPIICDRVGSSWGSLIFVALYAVTSAAWMRHAQKKGWL